MLAMLLILCAATMYRMRICKKSICRDIKIDCNEWEVDTDVLLAA